MTEGQQKSCKNSSYFPHCESHCVYHRFESQVDSTAKVFSLQRAFRVVAGGIDRAYRRLVTDRKNAFQKKMLTFACGNSVTLAAAVKNNRKVIRKVSHYNCIDSHAIG